MILQTHSCLIPNDSYSNEQKQLSGDRVGIAKKPEIKAWSGPFIMATANTRVVRRTEAFACIKARILWG
jgi:short subunit dehydrogenase-like uncharacterized protein